MNPREARSVECVNELGGWRLHLCRLQAEPGTHEGTLRLAIGGTLAGLHGRFAGSSLLADPVVQSVRRLVASAGVDPDRVPPESERFVQAILAGAEFPRRSPAEDLCRLLVLKTLVPWSVVDAASLVPPLTFRLGRERESLRAEEGEPSVAGWPVLADARRVLATPLAGTSLPASVEPDEVLLIAFQPADVAATVEAKVHLARFVVMTWAFRFLEERTVPAGGHQ